MLAYCEEHGCQYSSNVQGVGNCDVEGAWAECTADCVPTASPTKEPTASPTTKIPTVTPTKEPSPLPTRRPSPFNQMFKMDEDESTHTETQDGVFPINLFLVIGGFLLVAIGASALIIVWCRSRSVAKVGKPVETEMAEVQFTQIDASGVSTENVDTL